MGVVLCDSMGVRFVVGGEKNKAPKKGKEVCCCTEV